MSRRRPRSLRAGLRVSRYGVPSLFLLGVAAVTPLTVINGFGQVKQLGTPVGYSLAALVLAVFAIGLAAMARHVPNSGAFYSYVAGLVAGRIAKGGMVAARSVSDRAAESLQGVRDRRAVSPGRAAHSCHLVPSQLGRARCVALAFSSPMTWAGMVSRPSGEPQR
jgi:hypothetical protein